MNKVDVLKIELSVGALGGPVQQGDFVSKIKSVLFFGENTI